MIRVRRSLVKKPAPLKGADSEAAKEREEAIDFYADAANKEKSFDFKVYKKDEVKAALNELFHHKCAYCESFFGATQPVDVEHFRPKSGVIVDGKLKKPAYYWLAADWNNLLPSCIDCNRRRKHKLDSGKEFSAGKANLFPIEHESRRAEAPDLERKEERLLINPCCDRPDAHLEFVDEGVVRAVVKSGNRPSGKGVASIEVFGLQRPELVQARRDRLLLIKAQIRHVEDLIADLDRDDVTPAFKQRLEQRLDRELTLLHDYEQEDKPYAGMARQFIRRFLDSIANP